MNLNTWQRAALCFIIAVCTLTLSIVLAGTCKADIRVNLVSRLNQYMDDAANAKMTSAAKILFLNQVGREMGHLGFYLKRDTIVTSANTELYGANTDFAGVIHAAYAKVGTARTVIRVVPRDSVFLAPRSSSRSTTFLFVEDNSTYGIDPLPTGVDTFIVIYHAFPSALSTDSTEWGLSDDVEDAALMIAAGRCMLKMPTAWSVEKSAALTQTGWDLLTRMSNPNSLTKQLGDTPR